MGPLPVSTHIQRDEQQLQGCVREQPRLHEQPQEQRAVRDAQREVPNVPTRSQPHAQDTREKTQAFCVGQRRAQQPERGRIESIDQYAHTSFWESIVLGFAITNLVTAGIVPRGATREGNFACTETAQRLRAPFGTRI